MTRVLFGLLIVPSVVALIWVADRTAGTGWAPVVALICLPVLVLTFRKVPL